MRLAEVLRLIKAVRASDQAAASVSIDRVSNGQTTYGVKCSGRDVRAVAKRARTVYDDLAKAYGGKG